MVLPYLHYNFASIGRHKLPDAKVVRVDSDAGAWNFRCTLPQHHYRNPSTFHQPPTQPTRPLPFLLKLLTSKHTPVSINSTSDPNPGNDYQSPIHIVEPHPFLDDIAHAAVRQDILRSHADNADDPDF
jgi:hypothetical protein